MNSISWYEYHHWQPDEDQGIDYQHQFSIRKLVGFFMEQSLQIGGVWSFYKAMSDKVERYPLVKCSRAVFFSILNCAFLRLLFLINVAWFLTTLNTYWIKSLIYDQLTNIASWGEVFGRNQCTVLYKSLEHKAYCLLISFIFAGIKAVFQYKGVC